MPAGASSTAAWRSERLKEEARRLPGIASTREAGAADVFQVVVMIRVRSAQVANGGGHRDGAPEHEERWESEAGSGQRGREPAGAGVEPEGAGAREGLRRDERAEERWRE